MRRFFFMLLAIFSIFNAFALEMDNEISYIYLKNALLTEDDDLSLSFLLKAYEFNSESSDILYLLADKTPNLDYKTKVSYLEKSIDLNNWAVFSAQKALSLYLEVLILSHDYKNVIAYASSYKNLVRENPDLLYSYLLVMRELEMGKPLEEMVELAWNRYSNDIRFWEFFISQEKYFISFYSLLEDVNVLPLDILPSLLYNLPQEEALRKAYLSLFSLKSQDTILYAFLMLEELFSPEEFLAILEERKDIYYLDILKRIYDFLEDPLKSSYQEWLSVLSGEFFWRGKNSILVDNFLRVSQGELVEWIYRGDMSSQVSLSFFQKEPSFYSTKEGIRINYENYPFVRTITLTKNELDTLNRDSFSLPLFSQSWKFREEPVLFIPLEESLKDLLPNLKEEKWLSSLIKRERFSDSGNLIYQANYMNGNLLRKAYKIGPNQKNFNFLEFYDSNRLSSSLWDLNENGFFDIMAIYPNDSQTYVLVDINSDGLVDYIYTLNSFFKVDSFYTSSSESIDHAFIIQQQINNMQGFSIPLDSPEGKKWRSIPSFSIEEGEKI